MTYGELRQGVARFGLSSKSEFALVTLDNPKLVKSIALGYLNAVVHLAPHRKARVGNVCRFSTHECRMLCLHEQTKWKRVVHIARNARTVLWKTDPALFRSTLECELGKLERKAEKKRLEPCIRPNGTSDEIELALAVCDATEMRVYDYTKRPISDALVNSLPANYHLTYSFNGTNERLARVALDCGVNVAVVFANDLPDSFKLEGKEFQVIDGTAHDLRFTDPANVIVGLKFIGTANTSKLRFVV